MPRKIELNIEGLTKDVADLRREIADFESYTGGFFDSVIDSIAPFNADFTNRIGRMLNNMRDRRTPELQTRLHNYVNSIETAKVTFAETDATISESFSPQRGDNRDN